MSAHVHGVNGASFLQAAVMWQLMMAAMMMPVAFPWVRAASTFVESRSAYARLAQTVVFVCGYLTIWSVYSLIAAGAQVALSDAQLRNPFTYLLARWHSNRPGLFRMGMSHGMYCVACCWALMATAFALGVMNLVWMGVLAMATCAEQMLPWGKSIAASLGVGLLAWGLVTVWS
jgi:predicted metal-binding membrane protein